MNFNFFFERASMQKGGSLRGADKIKFRPIVPLLVDLGAAAASAKEQKWRRSCKRAFFCSVL